MIKIVTDQIDSNLPITGTDQTDLVFLSHCAMGYFRTSALYIFTRPVGRLVFNKYMNLFC